MKPTPIPGLYAPNDLPIWAAQVLLWLQFEATIRIVDTKLQEAVAEYDKKSWWHKIWHGRPSSYAPRAFRLNPFDRPAADALEKFEVTYPDMAKEWRK